MLIYDERGGMVAVYEADEPLNCLDLPIDSFVYVRRFLRDTQGEFIRDDAACAMAKMISEAPALSQKLETVSRERDEWRERFNILSSNFAQTHKDKEALIEQRDTACQREDVAHMKLECANLQVGELTEAARELVENDGAGADYDACKAYHAREKLRKLIYSEKRNPEHCGKPMRFDNRDYQSHIWVCGACGATSPCDHRCCGGHRP